MATLYICEYQTAAWTTAGGLPSAQEPPIAEQTVAIGGTSAPSVVFNVATRFVRIHTDVVCSIKFGAATPTAAATNKRLAANSTEYFGVRGGVDMVAVITNT